MSSYFITSCGTEIGKTFATCALIHAARAKNIDVAAYKPVMSGFDDANPAPSDAGMILQALNNDQTLDEISPWRYAAPLSPYMAAAAEGKTLPVHALIDWCRARIDAKPLTLFEGVGGAMVPLDDRYTVRDWAAALGIPAILVTGSYLGSISHTLTAIEALRAKNIPIAALIVNASKDSAVPLADTLATYAQHARDIPLRIAQARVASPAMATDIHALIEHLL